MTKTFPERAITTPAARKAHGEVSREPAPPSARVRHQTAGHITTNIGSTVVTEESRSWIDLVREHVRVINWPRSLRSCRR